ncbi:ectonucleoside triphosphate diphosphohydrolase 3 [Bombina bombina]|uniref:ectonucleoside triphosphate diphosphohydrolase 3 n=1 Tax=Bombina bombina TaxID=8345 RepID=UPI00235AC599|nr:ectonucleoside triphosphate diphosphohydrolase 3 [Bombina bombina]XP_053570245.1 ectonucleoside triphosphate diphosphohydrolase 3 [Bombina bombina]
MPPRVKIPIIFAVLFLLISVSVIITIAFVQFHHKKPVSPGLKYGIVLDAGSSRTTVYVYQWPAEKENNTGVVSQTYKCNVNGKGISSYDNEPDKACESINECMMKVKEKIPLNQHNSTPVYLGATAGMRLLRLKNESAAQGILTSIRNYFTTQPFDFKTAHIITGQEEGVYGWITVNYLMDNFLEKNIWRAWVRPEGAETTGALDLGGASTQISFIPEMSEQNVNNTVEVTLYGYQYNVYTHSFQCYGRDEAEKRLLAALVQSQPNKLRVGNPCYPLNYEVNFTSGHMFRTLCSAPYRPANYHPDDIITFRGTGDPAMCSAKVASLFNFTACYGSQNCSFDGVYQPKVKGTFSAFSGFYYTANALNLTGRFTLNEFNASVWSFCSQEWSKLPKIIPKFDEKYAKSYCFSANYIYYLLVHGYKFDAESWQNIIFQKEVENSSIAWSLGYMLNLTNMIPAEKARILLPMSPSLFAGLLFLFAVMSLVCLIFFIFLVARACFA